MKRFFSMILVVVIIASVMHMPVSQVSAASIFATLTDNSSGTSLNFRVDYGGTGTTISSGDTIVITMTPSVSGKIKIYGFSDNAPIYNDASVEVGIRTFSYGGDGSCTLTLTFNGAYAGLNDVSGWYTASAYMQYVDVVNPGDVTVKVQINGEASFITRPVPEGGPGVGPGGTDFTPGAGFSKYWRYGTNSGNEAFQAYSADGDYTKFDNMRWYIPMGFSNLTNRDRRASNGTAFWTTPDSIAYSNNNPSPAAPWDKYNTANESYLEYWYWSGGTQTKYSVNEPFHYNGVVLDDYLDVGNNYGSNLCSPHDYVRDSIRIVRVIGRDQSDANYFKNIADSNFLKQTNGVNMEEIFRYSDGVNSQSPFPGYRGLTLEEFFAQMKSEGQFSGYSSWEDIITFDLVNNQSNYYVGSTLVNGGTGDPSVQIPHFQLNLGDFHFNNTYLGTVTGQKQDGTVWATVTAKNLPYAYLIYYDTKATGIELDASFTFKYFNRATLSYGGVTTGVDFVPMPMKYEASGGSGDIPATTTPASLKIKKIDESNIAVQGVTFTLTNTAGYSQTRTTANDGTASFIVNSPGTYTLTETLPSGSGLVPIASITFEITQNDLNSKIINLKAKLPSGNANEDDITFVTDVNTIMNHEGDVPPTPTGSLILKKEVAGTTTTDPFTFTVTFGGAGLNFTGITISTNGSAEAPFTNGGTVTLMHNETATFTNIPLNATYTIAEADYSAAGYSPAYSPAGSDTGTIASSSAVNVLCTNTFTAPTPDDDPPTPPDLKTSVKIGITKEISGITSTSEIFKFTLKQLNDSKAGNFKDGEGVTTLEEEVTGKGSAEFTVSGLTEGTYYYQINETPGSAGNWKYDDAARIVTVTVTVNEEDDSLDASVSVSGSLTFVNTYTPPYVPSDITPDPTTTTPPTTTPTTTTTEAPTTTVADDKGEEPTTTTTTETSTEPPIEEERVTEQPITNTEPVTEPAISEATVYESPVTIATEPAAGDFEEYDEFYNDRRVPLGNGWFAEYNEEEDLWYIYDENGTPLGTVKLPEGMSIEEYDFGDWAPPLANIPSDEDRPNPPTGDAGLPLYLSLLTGACLMTAIGINFKFKRKKT